jgi:hypothetical protein
MGQLEGGLFDRRPSGDIPQGEPKHFATLASAQCDELLVESRRRHFGIGRPHPSRSPRCVMNILSRQPGEGFRIREQSFC